MRSAPFIEPRWRIFNREQSRLIRRENPYEPAETQDSPAATKKNFTAETQRTQRKEPRNRLLGELRVSAVKPAACSPSRSGYDSRLSSTSDFEAFPDLVDCRIDEELEQERGEDAPDHRRGDAAHHIRPGASRP